jgi:phage portal protein BeeE
MIGALDFQHYTRQWVAEQWEEIYGPGPSWLDRPDPNVTRNFLLAQTACDLFIDGRAFWYVTSRYSNGFPASFTWLPHEIVNTPDQTGPQYLRPAKTIQVQGQTINTNDVVQFLAPINGITITAQRTLDIAIRLDEAARRFASSEIAAGYLQQTGGEPMSGDELAELAEGWASNRRDNAIGALNEYVKFVEFDSNPSTLQLVEGRQYSALELARVANIPPYLVGIATGGMTYQNAQQARQDLYLFGAKPFIDCIEQTLSGPNVLPRGQYVRLDVERYLGDSHIVDDIATEPAAEPVGEPAT